MHANKLPSSNRFLVWLPLCLMTLCPIFGGCSSLMGSRTRGPLDNLDLDGLKAAGYSVDRTGVSAPIPVQEDGRPSIILEVHDGKKHYERIPLPAEKPTFVADVVRDAQLTEKIGRIDVAILRPSGPGMPPLGWMSTSTARERTSWKGKITRFDLATIYWFAKTMKGCLIVSWPA